jgi:hypothetical protein
MAGTHRSAAGIRRDSKLVESVPDFMQDAEKRIRKIVLVDARCDADVVAGEWGAERMRREIDPAPLQVVAEIDCDLGRERQLLSRWEMLTQTAVIGNWMCGDDLNERKQFGAQLGEKIRDLFG